MIGKPATTDDALVVTTYFDPGLFPPGAVVVMGAALPTTDPVVAVTT
jgi:hypothetical protein